ncbi:hypothetical protein G6F23_011656 [Rhizopus arrhizus]|nr:hypothetical protein G6F23_011656 [Rhizopus arrhizus]
MESRHLGFASVKFESYFYPNITFYEIIKQEESSSTRDVIFCMNQTQQLSDQGRYYQFPHEAIVEALNHTSTFDVLVSFHLPKDSNLSVLHSACSCKNASKLEEFANVCTRPKRRLTDPSLLQPQQPRSDCYAINIGLTGVSDILLSALKQTVFNFETRYEKMIELMKLHNQQVTAQKMIGPLDTREEKSGWLSSDEGEEIEEEEEEEEEEIEEIESTIGITSTDSTMETDSTPPASANNKPNKQCSYCGSKSTPMWRRGPEGAGTLCNACGVKWKHGKILCGGTEYFPPQTKSTRNFVEKKKRKYKKRVKKEEHQLAITKSSNNKRAAAAAAAAAIVAGNKYGSDLDILLNSEEEQEQPSHHHRRRHTTDISMIQTYGFNSTFDAGVDAVEAAAVLTLLKRS